MLSDKISIYEILPLMGLLINRFFKYTFLLAAEKAKSEMISFLMVCRTGSPLLSP